MNSSEFRKIGPACFEYPKKEGMRVPVRVFVKDEMLSNMMTDRTLGQAINVSSLPGILEASFVMPDGHEGYGFPIGGVAAFDSEQGVVSPGGVGFDINCGVRLLSTNLSYEQTKPKIRELVAALYKNIPSGVGSKSDVRLELPELEYAVTNGVKWALEKGYGVKEDLERIEENGAMAGADFSKVSDLAKKRGKPQFGTLGSGNHFAEIQRVDKIFDKQVAQKFGITGENQVTVMIHSGSRGFGHQVCSDSVRTMISASRKYGFNVSDRELSCAPLGSKEADDYFGAMNCAINFAFNNRQLMAHWTRKSFEQVFKKNWDSLEINSVYDVCHNVAKFEEHVVEGKSKNVCVHRKGATRAFGPGRKEVPACYRGVGQPVIIPGSMSTASYLLCGLAGSEKSFGSSCHGAGRVMSRKQATETFKGDQLKKEMEEQGTFVQAGSLKGLAEEAGGAYKNVDGVVESVELAGLCKIVARMVPVGVIKG